MHAEGGGGKKGGVVGKTESVIGKGRERGRRSRRETGMGDVITGDGGLF